MAIRHCAQPGISEAQEPIPLVIMPHPMLILNGEMNLKHHMLRVFRLGDHASNESYFAYGGPTWACGIPNILKR